MDRKILIQGIIDYIESNLTADLKTEELADMTGYSFYHFMRLFRAYTGMSVKQFIDRRKLLHASHEISRGEFAVEVALKYGYLSYSGFYRAFVREFGLSPTEFASVKRNKPYRIDLFKEEFMNVTIKTANDILAIYWNLHNLSVRNILYPSSGNMSENGFYVGDDYILKFSANLGGITNDISLSEAMYANGLLSSTCVKTISGCDYVLDGELYFYLTRRTHGQSVVAASLYDDNYFPDARFVGNIIGRLHHVLSEIDFPASENVLTEKVEKYISEVKVLLNLSERFCVDYMDTLHRLYPSLPKHIIHRDPNPSNIIGEGDLWGFSDFGLSEINVRIYDICYAATSVLSETYDEKNPEKFLRWLKIYRGMIEGYSDSVNLTDNEKEAIPYIILANQIVCTGYFSRYEKYTDIFDINKKMTLKLIEVFDDLKIK
ncbi:MAG: helix-turn-helix domain-containing protein [Eubacteriaceae bacterium]|nr:helix-turn-helix domain-containing protein [Eubacteriaceae bacterium]